MGRIQQPRFVSLLDYYMVRQHFATVTVALAEIYRGVEFPERKLR
jgi:hypothetical protein